MISELTVLDNGLPVILVDTQTFPTLSTLILVGAGSRYETKKNNGVAHFFEHMAFKGSKKYPSAFDISSAIEGLGGAFNAFTAKDHTGYYVKAPTEKFETIVDVLSDMILEPLLVPEEIEKEKGVIVEEINMYEDMPARKVSDIFDDLMFNGHPLSYEIAGTAETVTSFNRQTFTDYINDWYHPQNAVIVVAGGLSQMQNANFKVQNYLSILEKGFSSWQPKKSREVEQYTDNQNKLKMKIQYKKTEQAHFALGFPAYAFNDPRRYALTVLSGILGGGMSSRLFMEVRERRGLCYYVSTGREMYVDSGYIVTQAGVRNDKDSINKAIEVIWNEHQDIAKGNVSDDEIVKAKELLKGRFLLSLEDSFRVASLQGSRYLFEERLVDPKIIVEKIEAVTKDEIVDVAKDLFKHEKINLALIGPYRRKDLNLDL